MATNKRRDLRSLLSVPHLDLQLQVTSRLTRRGFPQLRPAQSQLLTLIEPGGVRLADLVATSGLAKQTVGDVIDDLESLKMVERYADPEHGVIKRVRLGAKGKVWAAEVRKVAEAAEAQLEATLGRSKMKTLRALLEEVSDAVESRNASAERSNTVASKKK
jgi:DNA-binding MarR family transcriptional regulator